MSKAIDDSTVLSTRRCVLTGALSGLVAATVAAVPSVAKSVAAEPDPAVVLDDKEWQRILGPMERSRRLTLEQRIKELRALIQEDFAERRRARVRARAQLRARAGDLPMLGALTDEQIDTLLEELRG